MNFARGRLIKNVIDELTIGGAYSALFNTSHLATGIYFLRVSIGGELEVIRFRV